MSPPNSDPVGHRKDSNEKPGTGAMEPTPPNQTIGPTKSYVKKWLDNLSNITSFVPRSLQAESVGTGGGCTNSTGKTTLTTKVEDAAQEKSSTSVIREGDS